MVAESVTLEGPVKGIYMLDTVVSLTEQRCVGLGTRLQNETIYCVMDCSTFHK